MPCPALFPLTPDVSFFHFLHTAFGFGFIARDTPSPVRGPREAGRADPPRVVLGLRTRHGR